MTWTSRLPSPSGPVVYDSGNHTQILFQCLGSLWPRVLPYCVLNSVIMFCLTKLQELDSVDFNISSKAHSFAGMIVSFLIVSRINTALSRYNESRGYLGSMYRETRELLQLSYIMTRRDNNHDAVAKEWRVELAYRALLMLRTSIAAVEYRTEFVPAWKIPELSGMELDYCTPDSDWRRHALTQVSDFADSMRIPLRLSYLVRETICGQEGRLKTPLATVETLKLLGSVDGFMQGWIGMRKFMTTPVPFPLIQMTRTIVLIYVFTLPFVFLDDSLLWEHCMAVFLLTYGFVGLELVSIELDDPFGNDANDFDCLAYARIVFEDTYLMIQDTDGVECADALRHRMNEKPWSQPNTIDGIPSTEESPLFHGPNSV